jgi:D-glycero-alpha-D-manno-heptose-7-phosphate kinase
MVDESISILTNTGSNIEEFGKLLDQGWKYKRTLSNRISSPEIDHIYEQARLAGAIGGKILGAGGGGFMLLFVRPENQAAVRERLKSLVHVPFNFESSGSKVVVYQPNGL